MFNCLTHKNGKMRIVVVTVGSSRSISRKRRSRSRSRTGLGVVRDGLVFLVILLLSSDSYSLLQDSVFAAAVAFQVLEDLSHETRALLHVWSSKIEGLKLHSPYAHGA